MLQSQLACGGFRVFHVSIVTLCPITGRYLAVLHPEGSFKAHCCCDLIAWQVTNRLIPLRAQEVLWIVLCLFLCAPGNNFLLWICYAVVYSYVWWCLSGDFLICFLVFNWTFIDRGVLSSETGAIKCQGKNSTCRKCVLLEQGAVIFSFQTRFPDRIASRRQEKLWLGITALPSVKSLFKIYKSRLLPC